jgi:hypothetical protein
MDVAVDAVDRPEPISMYVTVVGTVAGLPVVEYVHSGAKFLEHAPTVLGFSGGGGSGAMLAMLAEQLAARQIRLVSFDMPGHTPEGLLGAATPPRAMVSRVSGAVRRAVSLAMFRRWKVRSTQLQVLSHSAGIADVARLVGVYGNEVDRFLICGASIPGLSAMMDAAKAAASVDSRAPIRLASLIRTRQLPTAANDLLYGPPSDRSISDTTLARYECAEHFAVALTMLRSRLVLGQDWRGRRVLLVGSAGDAIVPACRIRDTERRLQARGAVVECRILPMKLPHAFLSFQAAAQSTAELIAEE